VKFPRTAVGLGPDRALQNNTIADLLVDALGQLSPSTQPARSALQVAKLFQAQCGFRDRPAASSPGPPHCAKNPSRCTPSGVGSSYGPPNHVRAPRSFDSRNLLDRALIQIAARRNGLSVRDNERDASAMLTPRLKASSIASRKQNRNRATATPKIVSSVRSGLAEDVQKISRMLATREASPRPPVALSPTSVLLCAGSLAT